AFAFLKAMGLKGEIGRFILDLGKNQLLTTSEGHTVVSTKKGGEFQIRSTRYPFCFCVPTNNFHSSYPVCANDNDRCDASIRSDMQFVSFENELNRFTLIAKNGKAVNYKVSWGNESKSFSKEQLAAGINLDQEFAIKPFSEALAKVDRAVAAKQE